MKFKERLWQLFLAIVLGVTLSVCDAGLQDDEFDSNALIAGSAIAAGITSGDNWVKIGDFMLMHGVFIATHDRPPNENIIQISESFNSNDVLVIISCRDTNTNNEPSSTSRVKTIQKSLGKGADYIDGCSGEKTINYSVIGKYK